MDSSINTITPYNEAVIVSLITEIYTILLKLRYIESSQLNYPPPNGYPLNKSLCVSLNLSPAVISLIEKLPCPIDEETALSFEFLTESRAVVYTDDKDLKESRDPNNAGTLEDIRLDYLLPSDVALTIGRLYGVSLVLDTKESLCYPFLFLF